MKKINIILLIIGMILCSSTPCKAENELGYAVYHLCQKMLAEPETAQNIECVLHHPSCYRLAPKGFDRLKPAELDLLVEQYKKEDFLQDYYDHICYFAFRQKLNYNELEKFVAETDNISAVYDLQSVYGSMRDAYFVNFNEIVARNLKDGVRNKPLVLNAPQWFVNAYKDVVDTLVSRTNFDYKGIKGLLESEGCSSEKAEAVVCGHKTYMEKNLPVFYFNFLYRFFPQKEKMDIVKCGFKVREFDYFSFDSKRHMDNMISKSFYEWCEKDNHIKNARKKAKEQGLVSDTRVFEKKRAKYFYDYMGPVLLLPDDYDEEPTYIGGDEAMMEYARKHLKYPAIAERNKVYSTVYVGFDVEKDGTVTNAKILCNDSRENFLMKLDSIISDKPIDAKRAEKLRQGLEALEAQSLKIVNGFGKMNPAKKNGEAIKCRFYFPFNYMSGNGAKFLDMFLGLGMPMPMNDK